MRINDILSFKQTLLEYSQEKTIQMLGKQLLATAKADKSIRHKEHLTDQQIVQMVVNNLEQADPTPHKEYTQWLARVYIKGAGAYWIEDVMTAGYAALETFNELKIRKKLPPEMRDINRIPSIEELHDRLVPFAQAAQPQQQRSKGKSTEFFKGNTVRIIIPEDENAAKYYGQGTTWCTAADKNCMFNAYNADGKLYIILPVKPSYTGEKYQIQFSPNEDQEHQIMDEKDEPVSLFALYSKYPELFEALRKPAEDANVALYNHVTAFDQQNIDKLKQKIVSWSMTAVREYLSTGKSRRAPTFPLRPPSLLNNFPNYQTISRALSSSGIIPTALSLLVDRCLNDPSYGYKSGDQDHQDREELIAALGDNIEPAKQALRKIATNVDERSREGFVDRVLRNFLNGLRNIIAVEVTEFVDKDAPEQEEDIDTDEWTRADWQRHWRRREEY